MATVEVQAQPLVTGPDEQFGTNGQPANGLSADGPRPVRWTTEQFHAMGDMGWFEGRHVELIEGEIIEMAAMNGPHATGVILASDLLREAFGQGYVVRVQMPLDVNQTTDPEPDVAIVSGHRRSHVQGHPTTALLVVEVSDTTLVRDQTDKASLYARAGIEDYWIVNLVDDHLEIRRRPVAAADQPFGWRYEDVQIMRRGQRVAPLAMSDVSILVDDLLPRVPQED